MGLIVDGKRLKYNILGTKMIASWGWEDRVSEI